MFETQPPCLFRPVQCPEDQYHGKKVPDAGSHSNPGDIPFENGHKKQTQQHVHSAGGDQIVEGSAGISRATHDRRSEVINHVQRHGGKVDLHVDTGKIDHIVRRLCPDQKLTGEQDTGDRHDPPDNKRKQQGGMGCAADFFPLPGSDVIGDQYVGADRKSEGSIDQQSAKRSGRPHSAKGLLGGKLAQHHHIGGMEQELQHTGRHQRQSKKNDTREQRPVRHINTVPGSRFGHREKPFRIILSI